jgi:predicted ribosome-associated RNA-binding protein Tma20
VSGSHDSRHGQFSEDDEVHVYYPDGTTEVMTRGAQRAKLIAWIRSVAGDDAQVVTDASGSVAHVLKGARAAVPGAYGVPWTTNA